MFVYQIFEEDEHLDEFGTYRSYGICVKNEGGEILAVVPDVATDVHAVAELAQRCTRGNLDPAQLRDVIVDFIETAALPER